MMDPVHERQENEARFLAWDVPADVQIIGLVHPSWLSPEEAERNARAADTIATAVARRREHTLLTSCETSNAPLDRLLGGGDRDGLSAALRGRVRLSDIALHRGDKPYVYLPAGKEPIDLATLFAGEAFRQFVERVRERGGTLLLHMPEDALADESLGRFLDGYLSLGDIYTRPVPPTRAVELGRLVLDTVEASTVVDIGAADAGESAADEVADEADEVVDEADEAVDEIDTGDLGVVGGEEDPGKTTEPETGGEQATEAVSTPTAAWMRHPAKGTLPTGRIVLGVAAVIIISGSWWLIARQAIEPSDPSLAAGEPGASSTGQAGQVAATDSDAPANPAVPSVEELEAIADAAPQLGYSVAMASSPVLAEAESRLAALRGRDGRLFYIAPTPVRGDTYYRVLAGAVADQAAGQALMEALVAEGLKGSATAWDVRPVTLTFRLGVYPDRTAAESALSEVGGAGILAYILPASGGADTVFQLLSGGYGSATAAETMQTILREAGRDAELVTRRGTLR